MSSNVGADLTVGAGHRAFDRAGLVGRVAPFAASAATAALLAIVDVSSADPFWLALGALLGGITIGLALLGPWHRLPRWMDVLPPLVYVGAVAALRQATGGASSGFAPLYLVPVLWIALFGTTRQVAVTLAAVVIAMAAPIILVGDPLYPFGEWRRMVNSVAVGATLGFIVQRLVAESHAQTDRALAQGQSLQQSNEKLGMLLDGVKDYAVFMMDTAGRIVSWNAGAERIKGYARDEIIGQDFARFFTPEDNQRGRPQEILRLTEAKGRHEEQGMRVRKDGSRFLARLTFTALRDPAGNLQGFSEFSHDLSESRAAEDRYRGLLEAAPDAMVVVDQAGKIVLLNVQAEKQFGYSRDELIGQRVTNIIPEGFAERLIADDLRSTEEALAQVIGTGIELVALRKDGTEFPIEMMLSPLASAEGILVTAAIRDISARRAAEAQLAQAMDELSRSNVELGQFAYIASHDLQEPLRMVASYTQLLSRRYAGKLDSDADEFIAYAVDGANRMQRLIEDLLAFSRVGTKGLEFVDTSSEQALDYALMNLKGAVDSTGALVTHDPLPQVLADERQLTQLFQNLVGNAIKYQNGGTPRVHVSAVQDDDQRWTFSVVDNGMGIDSQYFDKIFGMFQRLHGRDEYSGTGIGLAICKKIVERHGGSLTVQSEVGHGSTFRFSLAASEATT